MKAWHRYVQRQKNQALKNSVMENCDAYIEHMDLLMLWVLHEDFGFGAERLKRAYHALDKKFEDFRRYMGDDRTKFNEGVERDDTWALKYKLREIGFDYEEEVRRGTEGEV